MKERKYVDFALRLRVGLENKGMSQTDLARAIHLPQSNVSRFACGWQLPPTESLISICRVLSVSSDFLLGLKEGASE